jgi:hypothetical protein
MQTQTTNNGEVTRQSCTGQVGLDPTYQSSTRHLPVVFKSFHGRAEHSGTVQKRNSFHCGLPFITSPPDRLQPQSPHVPTLRFVRWSGGDVPEIFFRPDSLRLVLS